MDFTNVQLGQESFHWDEQGIHISHTDGFPIKWNSEKPMFILKIKADQYNSMLSNLICLDGRLEPEYYLEDVSEHGLDLNFEDQKNDSFIFNVLPNPAQEHCWLTSNVSNSVNFEIVNIHGQRMQTGKFNGSFQLETRAWTLGIYFIRFYQADQMLESKRLVIIK
ncbi:MAG: T9SS type A sorting domain-containing protein [Saprospiraceae bacterium]|nr:T9SS type A sorting domain-containing protein [Saprospiraceae bacterium]